MSLRGGGGRSEGVQHAVQCGEVWEVGYQRVGNESRDVYGGWVYTNPFMCTPPWSCCSTVGHSRALANLSSVMR